ncbi:MAG: sensor histidine kinase [Intestinibacillus sp.]
MKRFSRNWYCKFIAYLLILGLAGTFVISFLTIGSKVSNPSAFESKTYADSSVCSDEFARVISNIIVMQYEYVSEENVRKGGAVDEYAMYQSIYSGPYYLDYRQSYENEQNRKNSNTETADTGPYTPTPADLNVSIAVMQQHPDWEMFEDGVFVRYLSEHPEVVENAKRSIIEDQLRNLQRVQTFLDSVSGQFAYSSYRAATDTTLKNAVDNTIIQMPLYAKYELLENNIIVYRNGEAKRWMETDYSSYLSQDRIQPDDTLIVGIQPDYLAQREQQWVQDHRIATDCMVVMILSIILAVALFVYLCIVTGRLPGETNVRLFLIDRMYSEVHVALIIGLIVIFPFLFEATARVPVTDLAPIVVPAICGVLAVGMPLILSLIRSLKAHRFIRSFAIGRLCIRLVHWGVRSVRAVWNGGGLMARGMLLAVLVPLLCMPWFTVPFVIAGGIYFTYRTISKFQRIQEGVQQVRGGNLEYKIDVVGGDLGALAQDINTLSEGLETAISSEIKAERLKTELISNVGHDIKTPLTSIVTYVDLLKNELAGDNPDREKSREYIGVIDQKAHRLRVLTNDLFEAAKATSGAMTVALEQVDVSALIRQGLGEFDDKLQAAELDVRVHMPEQSAYMHADGRLVWRIFENMLSNVVKYALPGSRVYVDVRRGHGMVTLTMKNISAYELNIPAEELMERFKRGDESRSSDGSGLGLSIATSLAQLQHGVFQIEIDGDLFKASLSIPEYHEDYAKK